MTKEADDLEAVRSIVGTLQPFATEDRERIFRWAAEKLQMGLPTTSSGLVSPPADLAQADPLSAAASPVAADIKSLLSQKKPKNDRQLAAVVAYYFQFLASPSERKKAIDKEDLLEACRKGDWPRPGKPSQTLVNSFNSGFLDRTDEKGKYRLNTVGENLVAMVLPGGEGSPAHGATPVPKVRSIPKRKPAKAAQKARKKQIKK